MHRCVIFATRDHFNDHSIQSKYLHSFPTGLCNSVALGYHVHLSKKFPMMGKWLAPTVCGEMDLDRRSTV